MDQREQLINDRLSKVEGDILNQAQQFKIAGRNFK
jgi:hypothetical protein